MSTFKFQSHPNQTVPIKSQHLGATTKSATGQSSQQSGQTSQYAGQTSQYAGQTSQYSGQTTQTKQYTGQTASQYASGAGQGSYVASQTGANVAYTAGANIASSNQGSYMPAVQQSYAASQGNYGTGGSNYGATHSSYVAGQTTAAQQNQAQYNAMVEQQSAALKQLAVPNGSMVPSVRESVGAESDYVPSQKYKKSNKLSPKRQPVIDSAPDIDETVLQYTQWLSDNKQKNADKFKDLSTEVENIKAEMKRSKDNFEETRTANKAFQAQAIESFQDLGKEQKKTGERVLTLEEVFEQHRSLTTQELNELKSQDMRCFGHVEKLRHQEETHYKNTESALAMLKAQSVALKEETEDIKKDVDNRERGYIASFQQLNAVVEKHANEIKTLADSDEALKQQCSSEHKVLLAQVEDLKQSMDDFQKHIKKMLDRIDSKVFMLDEFKRLAETVETKLQAQVEGLHNTLYTTANEVTLLKAQLNPETAEPMNNAMLRYKDSRQYDQTPQQMQYDQTPQQMQLANYY
eukprot:Platyproteum_vivax@DN6601_c0_g1_i1.p1